MSTPTARIQENATLAAYGWSMFSKGKHFIRSMAYLYHDVEQLTESKLTHIFMEAQALLYPWSENAYNLTPPANATQTTTFIGFKKVHSTLKGYVTSLTNHPLSVYARSFFFYKQTLDFTIATAQWATKQRNTKSLFAHGVNTALAYIPFFTAANIMGSSLPAQIAINIITIACLSYSIRQDFIRTSNKKEREPSPSVSLIRAYALPQVQKIARKFLG